MPKRLLPLLLLLPLLVGGCRSTKPATVTEPTPAAEVPSETPKRCYTAISFDGEVEGITVNGQVRIAQDSVIWLSVTKVIEMGRAMCTPDSLWLRVPLMGRDEAMDYATLQRLTGEKLTYSDAQDILLSDNPEERVAELARRMGFSAKVRITRRQTAERLTFPYTKPIHQ